MVLSRLISYDRTQLGGIINTLAKAGRWKDAVTVLESMTGMCVCACIFHVCASVSYLKDVWMKYMCVCV